MNIKIIKIPKLVIVIVFVVWLIYAASFVLASSGMICTSYKGFAVDVFGNIYVGKQSEIEVYSEDGRFVRSFSSKTSRGYSFAIYDEDTILIDTADKLYTLDLYGNVLSENEENYKRIYNQKVFESVNGDIYRIKNTFFRTSLVCIKNDIENLVFEMPLSDYIGKLIDSLFPVILCIVFIIVVLFNKNQINLLIDEAVFAKK